MSRKEPKLQRQDGYMSKRLRGRERSRRCARKRKKRKPLAQTEVWAELGLEKNQILQSNPSLRGKMINLLEEYLNVFSSPKKMYGQTDLVEFDIELKEGSKPSNARCRLHNTKQK